MALAVETDTEEGLTFKALAMISGWLRTRGLELAPEKTEAVMIRGPRGKRNGVTFSLEGSH